MADGWDEEAVAERSETRERAPSSTKPMLSRFSCTTCACTQQATAWMRRLCGQRAAHLDEGSADGSTTDAGAQKTVRIVFKGPTVNTTVHDYGLRKHEAVEYETSGVMHIQTESKPATERRLFRCVVKQVTVLPLSLLLSIP